MGLRKDFLRTKWRDSDVKFKYRAVTVRMCLPKILTTKGVKEKWDRDADM